MCYYAYNKDNKYNRHPRVREIGGTIMYLAKRDNSSNFFDDFFKAPFWSNTVEQVSGRLMKTDVREREKDFVVEMELPGCQKEDIQVELKEGYLTVTAKKATSLDESVEGKFIRKERFEGSCKRTFYVGEYANEQNIAASYNDGVLRLEIPKEPIPEPEQPRYINIQ